MSTNGKDIFFVEPGTLEAMTCVTCGSACSVTRNATGPTTWAAALAGRSTPHDRFECPHAHQKWHDQAADLQEALGDCPSPRLARLIRLDLRDALRANLLPREEARP